MVFLNFHILGGCPPSSLRILMIILMAGVIFTEPEVSVDADADADAYADVNADFELRRF